MIDAELRTIVKALKDPATKQNGLAKLEKFQRNNPTYNFGANFEKEGKMFAQQVMIDLENFKKSSSNMGSTNATSNSFGASGGLARDAAQRP